MEINYQGYQNRLQSVINHQAIGFDVDHCLVRYKINALTKLCYEVLGLSLIERFNYPTSILDLTEQEYGFALNYLVIHLNTGVIARIAEDLKIIKCYRGFRELNVEAEYGPNRVLPDFNPGGSMRMDPNYIVCATYFENMIPLLFAKLCQYHCNLQNTNQLDPQAYHQIFEQIITSLKMNYQHFDQHKVYPICEYGRFFKSIHDNPDKFIFKQNQFRAILQNLKSQGKLLFIVTNSHYEFMNLTMTFSYGEDWQDLFDYVFVKGGKPDFFNNPNKPTFLLDLDNPLMKGQQVNTFVHNQKFYVEGNYTLIEECMQQRFNEIGRVLYLGDHIMNDCYFSQQNPNWDGIAIVEELYEEMEQQNEYKIEAQNNIIKYQHYWGQYLQSYFNHRYLKNFWYSVACRDLAGVIRTLDCPLTVSLWE